MAEQPNSTDQTRWPANVAGPLRQLIDRYFALLRTKEPGIGDILAEQVFAPDARARFASKWFEGSDEIRKCREHAWVDTEARHDTVFSAYVHDAEGGDLLLLCETFLKLKNGQSVTTDFVAAMSFDDPQGPEPRLKSYYTLWDSAPLRNALSRS
ncbi:hypothetical protein N7523_011155 [Penicillium sp. IBT 18751x]|nr:hypothetical protein N7523_011155 [Penicillium sp. IBT 18751x]